MNCLNCDTEFSTEFCPTCGQKRKTDRISYAYVVNGLVNSFTNIEKGYLYNIKNLTVKPKKIIQDYLSGKRINIYNPISYAILNITIFIILDSSFNNGSLLIERFKEFIPRSEASFQFLIKSFKYFFILYIFVVALGFKFFYSSLNLFEHIAVSSFIMGHASILGIITYFKMPLIFANPYVMLYSFVLFIIFYSSKGNSFKAILSSIIVYSIGFFIVFILAVLSSKFFVQIM